MVIASRHARAGTILPCVRSRTDANGYVRHVCENEGVQLHTVQMNITGMMNFGPGVIGLSCPEHRPQL